jgi:hypothetical protein
MLPPTTPLVVFKDIETAMLNFIIAGFALSFTLFCTKWSSESNDS